MSKFQRSWELFKASLTVMRQHRRLLIFPILVTAATFILVSLFVAGYTLRPTGYSYTSAEHWKAISQGFYRETHSSNGSSVTANVPTDPVSMGYFAVVYLVSMITATFFNVAFYHQIMQALSGQPVSIRAGLAFATTKWKAILMWSLFAGVVGYIIRELEQRSGFLGRIIFSLLGTAWSIACVFVIPVIITDPEATNPLKALKNSALTLKQTWGESLIGYAGVSLGSGLVVLFSLLWLGISVGLAIALQAWWLAILSFVGWLICIFLFSYLLSVASQIFRCALYLYATEGYLPMPYNEDMMQMAWKVKTK